MISLMISLINILFKKLQSTKNRETGRTTMEMLLKIPCISFHCHTNISRAVYPLSADLKVH